MADQLGTIYLSRQLQVGMKLETDRGTPATLADADFNILMRDVKLALAPEENIRKYAVGDPYNFQSVIGRIPVTLSGQVDLQGSGAAGTDPVFFKMLAAGPFILSAPDDLRAAILALGNRTATFVLQEKQFAATAPTGKEYTIAGACLSKLVIHWDNTGELQRMDVEYLAKWDGLTDINNAGLKVPVLDDDDTVPPAVLGIDCTYRTVPLPTQMLSIDFGLKTALIQYPGDDTGFAYAICGDFDPVVNFAPLIQPEATQGYYADLTNTGSAGAFSTSIGSGVGKFITIVAPNAQVVKALDLNERDNVDATDITLRCLRTDDTDNPCIGIFMDATVP